MKKEEGLLVVADVAKAVAKVYEREKAPLAQMREVVLLVRDRLAGLKAALLERGFGSVEEEVHFFKVVWPGVYSWQVYAADRFAVDLAQPVDVRDRVLEYLLGEVDYVQRMFGRYRMHYAYFRQGMADLDGLWFLREGKGDAVLGALDGEMDGDVLCCCAYCLSLGEVYRGSAVEG